MATKLDPEEKLARIADGFADAFFEMTDAEVLEHARATGKDPDASARRVRGVLTRATRQHRKTGPLARARERWEAKRDAIASIEVDLPATAAGRLRLLTSVLRRQPELGSAITVQHRQIRDLPDEDVISLLRQLAALGALDDP